MASKMDYIVKDSSVIPNQISRELFNYHDSRIRVGMVREEKMTSDGVRYIVEVLTGGKQVPVSCTVMSRFGGVYNYEEYRVRPWMNGFPSGMLPPSSAGKYSTRSGDVVLVAYLDGQAREGVILGGIRHGGRAEKTKEGDISYDSEFNGLQTSIYGDGAYKVQFKGTPVNTAAFNTPPSGTDVLPPIYNPLKSGSYFGFSGDGSFISSSGTGQFIKVNKSVGGAIVLQSGGTTVELSAGQLGIKSTAILIDVPLVTAKSIIFGVDALSTSLKTQFLYLGNDACELVTELIALIDALGALTITSPVGLCTPLNAAPTWIAMVETIKTKFITIKGNAATANPFAPLGNHDTNIGD